jgi:hypothetical protein
LNVVLEEVYNLASDDNGLSAKLDYSIKPKGASYEKRLSKVFRYRSLDKVHRRALEAARPVVDHPSQLLERLEGG